MSELVYKCWVKGIRGESGTPRRSVKWAGARRGPLKIYRDRLELGSWALPVEEIREPVVFRSSSLFMPVRVLQATVGEHTYQFGVNPWVRIERELPFDVEVEDVVLGYSKSSLVFRAILVVLVVRFLWRRFS
jgi:hypothetical protein